MVQTVPKQGTREGYSLLGLNRSNLGLGNCKYLLLEAVWGAKYVHQMLVIKCPIHNLFKLCCPPACVDSFFFSAVGQWLFLSGRITMPALLRREFNGLLGVSLVTPQKEEREASNKPF